MKEKTKKNPVPDNLKPFCFQPGQSGNPSGRPSKPKPVRLTEAYQRQLAKIDPDTGESFAHGVAAKMISMAINGDIRGIMQVLSQDSEDQIKQVIDELVKRESCTKKEASLALSLFAPGVDL